MSETISVFCIVFFFSSRRRHTIYWRDWSSDVCSSDLRFSLISRYLCQHTHSCTVHRSFRYDFNPYRKLLYHVYVVHIHSFGGKFEPRTSSAQDLLTSELLRTL